MPHDAGAPPPQRRTVGVTEDIPSDGPKGACPAPRRHSRHPLANRCFSFPSGTKVATLRLRGNRFRSIPDSGAFVARCPRPVSTSGPEGISAPPREWSRLRTLAAPAGVRVPPAAEGIMLHVQLFGRFGARLDARAVRVREGSKAQELLVYLLLHRERPHARESVACLLWDECSAEQSRSYLRKTLWQIHTTLCPREGCGCPLLRVDPRWVQVDPEAELSLDVAAFEGAHERTRGVPGRALDAPAARALADAVALYGGGLMLDCYEEWCLVARERLRHLQLVMLDKLMDHGEAHGDYEQALLYGMEILAHDTAREHTHRQMMRLHHRCGSTAPAWRCSTPSWAWARCPRPSPCSSRSAETPRRPRSRPPLCPTRPRRRVTRWTPSSRPWAPCTRASPRCAGRPSRSRWRCTPEMHRAPEAP